jgi:hypothetical protein
MSTDLPTLDEAHRAEMARQVLLAAAEFEHAAGRLRRLAEQLTIPGSNTASLASDTIWEVQHGGNEAGAVLRGLVHELAQSLRNSTHPAA